MSLSRSSLKKNPLKNFDEKIWNLNLLVSVLASSQRRNAPMVASSGLSTTFMLMTWTGVSDTESRELKHSNTWS